MTPLAAILAERGISQDELMRRTRLSKTTVANAYDGGRVSPLMMARIARALDVPLETLDPIAAQALANLGLRVGPAPG